MPKTVCAFCTAHAAPLTARDPPNSVANLERRRFLSCTGRLTPWCQIMTEIDLILTPEGFHYLDGVAYTEHGLVFQHIVRVSRRAACGRG